MIRPAVTLNKQTLWSNPYLPLVSMSPLHTHTRTHNTHTSLSDISTIYYPSPGIHLCIYPLIPSQSYCSLCKQCESKEPSRWSIKASLQNSFFVITHMYIPLPHSFVRKLSSNREKSILYWEHSGKTSYFVMEHDCLYFSLCIWSPLLH